MVPAFRTGDYGAGLRAAPRASSRASRRAATSRCRRSPLPRERAGAGRHADSVRRHDAGLPRHPDHQPDRSAAGGRRQALGAAAAGAAGRAASARSAAASAAALGRFGGRGAAGLAADSAALAAAAAAAAAAARVGERALLNSEQFQLERSSVARRQRHRGRQPGETLQEFRILPFNRVGTVERNRIVVAGRKRHELEPPIRTWTNRARVAVKCRGPAGTILRKYHDCVIGNRACRLASVTVPDTSCSRFVISISTPLTP